MSWRTPVQQISLAKVWDYLVDIAYHDQARLIEWLSFGLLLNFCQEFYFNPEVFDRDSYASFAYLGAIGWVVLTGIAATIQLGAIIWLWRRSAEVRSVAMIISFAFWLTVTMAFWTSGVSTTATYNYLGLSLSTFFAWLFLLWKTAGQP